MHLFSGGAPPAREITLTSRPVNLPENSEDERIANLEAEVSSLKRVVEDLRRQVLEFTEQFK